MNFNITKSLKDFYSNSRRVLDVSYKPDVSTFERTIKIVLLGTLILGFMGFVIATIIKFLTS